MIKCGDSTSDPDHGKDRSDSDACQVMRKDKTNRDCQTDIKKVETIFGKSYAFVDEIGDCLNNSISGIGDDTHVQRHGGTDACQNDGLGDVYKRQVRMMAMIRKRILPGKLPAKESG